MSVDNASLQGKTIAGRYRVVSTLGSGATAIVYKVKDQSLGSYLALKLLRAEKMTEAVTLVNHAMDTCGHAVYICAHPLDTRWRLQ